MAILTLRSQKGSPLTNNEVDGNFTALNNELIAASSAIASNLLSTNTQIGSITSQLDTLNANLATTDTTVGTMETQLSSVTSQVTNITNQVTNIQQGTSYPLHVINANSNATAFNTYWITSDITLNLPDTPADDAVVVIVAQTACTINPGSSTINGMNDVLYVDVFPASFSLQFTTEMGWAVI